MAINKIIQILVLNFFLACTQPNMIENPKADASKYSFLSLGDSYTIGERVSEADRWSVQLAGLLRKYGLDIANPDIIARTGWTTAELQDAIKASGNQKTYDLVSLLIGVNNQYRGQSQERYRTEFRELLQTATKFAGGKTAHVLVLSIPDWGVSPFAAGQNKASIAQAIDQFNAIANEECGKLGIAYIDITPLSRSASGDETQFASDGLHYSGKQMKQWAEKALATAKESLQK
ncbi:SGNH/GDSL hydrolase family protein [Spirosoma sp. KCTC 42546]|uniref:SGNH/GDSL hydrolase family protein n=1 Tax=Spirosoma sp. KCTC 42546 TaxID=2520506 RepID=UPI00352D0244